MAEKRGQYQYNDDGTVSQLVHNTNETAETSTVAIDHQATLTNTAVTHTSATIAPGAGNGQATWQLTPEGMSEFVTNMTMDVGNTQVYTNVFWSEDGTNISGKTSNTVQSGSSSQKTSSQWYPVGGAFYKSEVYNGDAAPKTCSANIKFRP
jgi:hypothetical protein